MQPEDQEKWDAFTKAVHVASTTLLGAEAEVLVTAEWPVHGTEVEVDEEGTTRFLATGAWTALNLSYCEADKAAYMLRREVSERHQLAHAEAIAGERLVPIKQKIGDMPEDEREAIKARAAQDNVVLTDDDTITTFIGMGDVDSDELTIPEEWGLDENGHME